MKILNKVVSIFISIFLLLILFTPTVIASNGEENFYSINVSWQNESEKTFSLSTMIRNGNVFIDAREFAKMFHLEVNIQEDKIVIIDKDNLLLIIFYNDNPTIEYVLLGTKLAYTAPFSSIIDENRAWIPFEMSLLLFDSSYIINERGIFIEPRRQTAANAIVQMIKKGVAYYNFDILKELGYDNISVKIKGGASHLINAFNGLLTFDKASWTLVFGLDTTQYDEKYGEELATLFCTLNQEELRELSDKIQLTYEATEKLLLDDLKYLNDSNVLQWDKVCQGMLARLDELNPPTIEYNTAYIQLEKALKNQDSFSIFTEALGASANIVSYGLKGYSYYNEFKNQDDFSLEAIKQFSSNLENSYLPSMSADSFKKTITSFEGNTSKYVLSQVIQDNQLKILDDIGLTKALLGSEGLDPSGRGLAIKLAWDLASAFTPLGKRLSEADKFELSFYATAFQTDAMLLYRNYADNLLENFNFSNKMEETIYSSYVYLKSCLIARQAGMASVSDYWWKQVPEYKKILADKNNDIISTMVQLKYAMCCDDKRMLGVSQDMVNEYLSKYNDEKLIEVIAKNIDNHVTPETFEIFKTMLATDKIFSASFSENDSIPQEIVFYPLLNDTGFYSDNLLSDNSIQILSEFWGRNIDRNSLEPNALGYLVWLSDGKYYFSNTEIDCFHNTTIDSAISLGNGKIKVVGKTDVYLNTMEVDDYKVLLGSYNMETVFQENSSSSYGYSICSQEYDKCNINYYSESNDIIYHPEIFKDIATGVIKKINETRTEAGLSALEENKDVELWLSEYFIKTTAQNYQEVLYDYLLYSGYPSIHTQTVFEDSSSLKLDDIYNMIDYDYIVDSEVTQCSLSMGVFNGEAKIYLAMLSNDYTNFEEGLSPRAE